MKSGLLLEHADIDTQYEILLKTLDEIKALIHENVLKTIKEETFIHYMNCASEIV